MEPFFRWISCQAFEEFATLWLDQFDQETLPADTVQVLCALTSSSKHVPARVPKRHLAARWRKKAEELLHHHSLLSKSEISTWHFAADDLLDTTQRMSKLAAKDAVYLAPWHGRGMGGHGSLDITSVDVSLA